MKWNSGLWSLGGGRAAAHHGEVTTTLPEVAPERVTSLDSLRTLLVAWIIGGHGLLGYSAIGGWAYDEINEVTFTPQVELVLAAVIGPSALFLMGTFFLVSGLFTPRSLEHKGAGTFARARLVRLGVPFVASLLVIWPLTLWVAYRVTGQDVEYLWLLTGRRRLLDSGSLWFAEVLLIFSLVYVLIVVVRGARSRRSPAEGRLTGGRLVLLALGIALVTFLVRLAVPARAGQPGDLHLWQWPQLAALFGLGIVAAGWGVASRVPDRLHRTCALVTAGTVLSLPFLAFAVGVDNLAQDVAPFLGGWRWQSLLMSSVEAMLVVFGSVWLLGYAQRTFAGTGRRVRAAARASFAAFVLQGPVLIALALALRPLPAPAEVKAPLVAAFGIAVCFALGHLLVTRTRLGKLL